jgi:hypothetical protein
LAGGTGSTAREASIVLLMSLTCIRALRIATLGVDCSKMDGPTVPIVY